MQAETFTSTELASHPVETGFAEGVSSPEVSPEQFEQPPQQPSVPVVPPDQVQPGQLGPCPVPWRHPLRALAWAIRGLFGLASLLFLLAVIAAIPGVNFLALGYLLDVEGRLGRSGRFRDGFPLLRDAPRIGSLALGIYLWLLPLRLISGIAADAHLIDPGGRSDVFAHLALNIAWGVITIHLILALARGGSLPTFFRPLKNALWLRRQLASGRYLSDASQHVRSFLARLKIRQNFWLGVRGFGVAFIWLALPTALYAAVRRPEGGSVLVMLIGGVCLTVVLSWAPFLQARFATENRFRSGLQLREVRTLWRYAPWSWALATVIVYALALPLYLFKAFLLPPDAMWPITLIFVASIYPTRVMTGWAYHRACARKEAGKKPVYWLFRGLCSLLLMSVLGFYVFLLYFTQFISEAGRAVLFQHHALLLPVPF
ncbi:DUF4013 domain-containing protein [Planctomicrobium piriforme]|uniref:DUF4013 domain-containing protein n=1 Tax=Planctomicrobium piriforme TaxID=1576369 RepID=A0A1I3KXT3_9PLAN|nr:DUF4013 domain-containing protein [Planctomicrobium piriforme]SFI77236.1 Protein of unknown function [Planctomicrobium piriforme]